MGHDEDKMDFPVHSCPAKVEIPTRKEQEALAELGKIKEQVRQKKAILERLRSAPDMREDESIAEIEAELGRLKEQWAVWDKRREDAAKERMVLLSQEQPDP